MTTEQIEFLVNLQKLYPKRSVQISKMLHFIASVNNETVWQQFTGELKEALANDDEKSLYLLEGLMRRMRGMLSEGEVVRAKKSRKKYLIIAMAVVIAAVIFILV
jgi:hypothetical protein